MFGICQRNTLVLQSFFSSTPSGEPDCCIQVREEQLPKWYTLLPVVQQVVQQACTHKISKTSLMSQLQVEGYLCLVLLTPSWTLSFKARFPMLFIPSFWRHLRGNKTDGGMRPIAIDNTLRRLGAWASEIPWNSLWICCCTISIRVRFSLWDRSIVHAAWIYFRSLQPGQIVVKLVFRSAIPFALMKCLPLLIN